MTTRIKKRLVRKMQKKSTPLNISQLKKDIEIARKEKLSGKSTEVNPKNVWQSIGL